MSEILWMSGLWVRTSVKVNLTKEEKVRIGRPSAPRWELDIVAYSGRENILNIVECKSYIDSLGVQASGFNGTKSPDQDRYKLFNDAVLRETIFGRTRIQLAECGACRPNAKIRLCLAAGKVRKQDRVWLRDHFKANNWEFWDEPWLKHKLKLMAEQGYENQVSSVVAKLLLRKYD